MVVRNIWRSALVGAPRLAAARAAGIVLVLGLATLDASAQEQPPVAAPPAAEQELGRVVVDKAQLRCWPSQVATPPVFEDELLKDAVVGLGAVDAGFREVRLPLGPVGYVAKKFTQTSAEGAVVTKGNGVSFRYRPRTSEAPVEYLADGTALAIVGEDADWWRARAVGVKAWLPEAEVVAIAPVTAADREAYTKSAEKYQAEVQARLAEIAAKLALATQDEADLAAVKVVEDAFNAELAKPAIEQRFEPLEGALKKLEASVGEASAARPAIASLERRIQTQRWIAEAVAVQQAVPVPATDVQPVVQPKDDLERFQSIGWLRYASSFGAPGTYFLEKGGKRLHVVTCTSLRYDLALFLDREVGLMGPRRRPAADGVSNLDIERLEVLGVSSR